MHPSSSYCKSFLQTVTSGSSQGLCLLHCPELGSSDHLRYCHSPGSRGLWQNWPAVPAPLNAGHQGDGSLLPAASHEPSPRVRTGAYCVSLEGFDGAVAAESADVDAHVCAAGREGRVVLPVHVQGGGCGQEQRASALTTCAHSPVGGQLRAQSPEASSSDAIKTAVPV